MKKIKKLTLLHSNDMHGDFMADDERGKLVGGVSLLSGYVQKVRNEEENVLYAISGDMFRGSVIDSEYKGLSTIEIMNMLAPDVVTIGNHEVDYGIAHLLFLEKCAKFPIVNANMYLTCNHSRLFQSHVIVEIDGMKIMFIGVLTKSVLAQTKQEHLIGSFVDVYDACEEIGKICNAYQKEDIDLTILLTHIGFEDDKKLAQQLDPNWGIDLIIGGHSHTYLEKPCIVNQIPIVQAACGSDQIGRFDLEIDIKTNKLKKYDWQLIEINDEHCYKDEEMEAIINKYHQETDEKYSRYITRFKHIYTHPSRNYESELGKIFADVFQSNLSLDIMLLASGSLRLKEIGPIITLRNLTQMFPFHDEIYQIRVSGKQFKKMMDYLFRMEALNHDHSEFYQFSKDLKIVIERNKAMIQELSYKGKDIDNYKSLRIGLQGYHFKNIQSIFGIDEEELKQIPYKILSTNAIDVLDEHLSELELVACPKDKRWIFI